MALVAVITCTAFLIQKTNKANADKDNQQENSHTSISINCANEVVMYLTDEPVVFNIEIVNPKDEEYKIQIDVNNSNIFFKDNKIYANNVGESILTINVLTKFKTLKKYVKVTVKKKEMTVNMQILNDTFDCVDKIFVSNKYYLQINSNDLKSKEFDIFTTENIADLSYFKTDSNSVLFTFFVSSCDTTKFIFSCEDYKEEFEIDCYEYIKKFDVEFENSHGNNIDLFLFNNEKSEQANLDNIYNSTSFKIGVNENNLPLFSITISNQNVAKIENNTIFALQEGECTMKITALDGSNYCEEYVISVNKILVESLTLKVENTTLKIGESEKIKIDISPVYALCDCKIYADKGLQIKDDMLCATKEGEFMLWVEDSISNKISSVKISVLGESVPEYYFEIEINQSFLEQYEANFNNGILTINKNENFVTVPLSYNCIVYDNPDIDITCEINVVCYNGIEVNYECISNAVIFNIKGSGKIDVKMSLVANSQIYYNFTIIKKWFCLYMLNFKLTC